MRWLALCACLSLLLAAGLTQGRTQVVIYRCTDAGGALTVQNDTPCPKGSRQERSVVDPPPPMPAYVPPPRVVPTHARPPPAAAEPTTAVPRPLAPPPAALADAERLPPPPIFQCHTWDKDSYLSEDSEPKPRCARLETTGLGGNTGIGAGEACEMKYDQCQRVPDGQACDGWRQRQREIESTWRHANGPDRPALQAGFARVSRILSDTTCGN